MAVLEGFPSIDLYARPRRERQKCERVNRLESLWIGGAIMVVLLMECFVLRDHASLESKVRGRVAEIVRLEQQKKGYEASRAEFVKQAERTRGIEGSLAVRSGWLRLMQAISSVMTDREALEQCAIDGRTQRSVVIMGSALDLTDLQEMLQRMKALRCLKGVRLLETAADKVLGPDSIHFRIEARCDAADLNAQAITR